MDYTSIIKYFISSGFIIGAIVFLAKKTIDYFANAGIEKYKNELNTKHQSFIAELNKLNAEHQVKFTKLHEDRAYVIKELYISLLRLKQRLDKLIDSESWLGTEVDFTVIKETTELFITIFNDNDIYFNDQTHELIKEIIFKIRTIESHFLYFLNLEDTKDEEKEKRIFKDYTVVMNRLNGEIQNLRIQLRKDFGKMLGVN